MVLYMWSVDLFAKLRSLLLAVMAVAALVPAAGHAIGKADHVLVVKGEYRLYLMQNEKVMQSFPVTFGANPKGHKQQQGDERTPEGRYSLGYKNPDSAFYKSIHISYPNEQDRESARQRGASPGGDIMIHGQPNGWGSWSRVIQLFNWTDGCIALSNRDMDIVWESVSPGIPIDIRP
jgi:murein L,D-transpeptidase YafK